MFYFFSGKELFFKIYSNDNNNDDKNEMSKSKNLNKSNNCNQWNPFTDNQNHPIVIGKDEDYAGARAVIGGINNHLLFITDVENNIKNEQVQERMKINQQIIKAVVQTRDRVIN
ncbi:hypothetical protein RFI_24634 [Reticulomyxa filosa]|uniref:Uncharacterized protein n=1 Tax=Reticulomyxa filosa TaxID=46433 RepID=X6MI54_RETFI|nr:hypothetical protein RFI_24634 [Reticulomyxa filosa]|eukprot:ETO12740.1 hypothetical protein RFI_24634 [Reticulomyxa filosa]